jgi:predicted RNA-binding Zn-ribbon protein involved in translation (DUF1610 family)
MTKNKFINLQISDEVCIVRVKVIETLPPEHTSTMICDHCGKNTAIPHTDYIQLGMFWDKHYLVTYCPNCNAATIYTYELE